MINISRHLFLDVKVDGNTIPDSFNLINTVSLCEGNGTLFPACKIIFNDLSGNLTDSLNLTDGNALSITSGKSPDDVSTVTRQYRVFGVKSQITPAGPQLHVVGIYDAPMFTTASVREGIKGTSTAVLKQIAEDCKLEYDGPDGETSDSQVWLNICRNRASFVQDVTRHGYIDQHSGMCCTLTSLGVLKYKDLMKVMEKKPTFTLCHNVPDGEPQGKVYYVKQARDSSKAGMMNSWQNYGSTRVVHNLTGEDTLEEKLEVKSSGKYLPINKQVSDTVKRARVEYSPLDCSNVHKKYERALYQNVKLLGLFVEKVSVLITEATDMQLFDTVYYRQADADLSKAAEPTDIYLVIGKSVHIKGSLSYAERLEIVRMSVTKKGKATLETQDPSSLREAATPESYMNPTVFTAAGTASLVALVTSLFDVAKNPTRAIYGALSQMGNFTNASSLQLGSLAGLMSEEGESGVGQHADQAIAALQLVNTPTKHLSSNVTTAATNYAVLDSGLDNSMQQITQLPLTQQSSVQRAGLQQASLFNPVGVVTSLAMALPILKALSQISSVYASVQHNLNNNREVLVNSDPMASQYIDTFNEYADNLHEQYANMSMSTNSIWNKAVSLTNNTTIPADLSNYSANKSILNGLATTALEVPPGKMNKVTPLDTTVNSLAGAFQTQDDNRNFLWMYPPVPLAATSRYTADELPQALDLMNNNSKMLAFITRENIIG